VLTLLLAGHETTAVTLSWAWFALGRHPQVRAALHAEVDSPAAAQALAEGHWDRLPYTRAVIAETLRLYPAAHVTSRVTTQDVDLGGHHLRKGTVCFVSPYGLHRDPRSWGDDVLAWRPERWLDAEGRYDEAAPGQPRGAYLPFGAGARICIGAAFATMESVLVLARLARDWDAELPAGFDPGMQPLVTLRPRHGVPATLHARRADVAAG
jgi:cytochrome P450